MVEITNDADALEWLNRQELQVQVWFAVRSVLRAVPVLGNIGDPAEEKFAFGTMRALLISAAAATGRVADIDELKAIANTRAARDFFNAAYSGSNKDSPPGCTIDAAYCAVSTFAHAQVQDAKYSASGAIGTAFQATKSSRIYSAATFDANAPLDWTSLWPETLDVDEQRQSWERLKLKWLDDPEDWNFWIEWYEAILAGVPLPWELTLRIAFEVTDNDWAAGQAVVGRRIAEIRDDWLSEQLPQAEDLSEDPATGRFDVRAAPFEKEKLIGSILSRIEFSLSLAVDSNSSDFNRMCTAFKYLDHTLTNCRDDPNAIEQNLGLAKGIIENNLSDPTYRADDGLKALAQSLEQHQLQIRADHPEVRKAWEKRIAQKIREVDRDTKLKAAEAIRAEQSRIQGRLSIETDLDAETVETEQPAEVQATAIRRATGRSAKMNILQRASQTAKDIDASGGYKATRIGTTGYTLVDFVLKILGG